MSEREEFDAIVKDFHECRGAGPGGGGCACLGGCLGNKLAKLRRKYDPPLDDQEVWWSDQLHGWLVKRSHDQEYSGQPLNSRNYWPPNKEGGINDA